MPKVAKKGPDIGREIEYLLATGNLRSRSGLGLQQVLYMYMLYIVYMRILCYTKIMCMYKRYVHVSIHVIA